MIDLEAAACRFAARDKEYITAYIPSNDSPLPSMLALALDHMNPIASLLLAERMLFTARSTAFVPVLRDASPGTHNVVRTERFSAHLPWLVLTYMLPGVAYACWETLCTITEKDLLNHLKDLPRVEIAQLLYMAPPRRSPSMKWSKHQIRFIERGRCDTTYVSVYTDDRGEQFCFDAPDVAPETVTHRRQILRVQPYRYFD